MTGRRLGKAARGLLLAGALACSRGDPGDPLVQRVEFGVFYGGQVQDRREIPFELDATRQTHGLSIDFRAPLEREVKVSWELDMPGTTRRVRDAEGRPGAGRRVKLEEAVVPRGRERFERVIKFEPGDPLGEWRVRVKVDERPVLERAFVVYDPAARDRQRSPDGGPR